MKTNNCWNEIELRDNRYNQIIHLVSAAKGAEKFYSTRVSFAPSSAFVTQLYFLKLSI